VYKWEEGLSIIIPCHNESGSIPELVKEIENSMAINKDIAVEVIWVDDASNDESFQIFRSLRPPHRCLKNPVRIGQSHSIQKAFENSKYKFIGIIDGDGQNSPTDLFEMLHILKHDTHLDFIQGIRAGRKDRFFSRKFPSYVANRMARLMLKTKIQDMGCATKVVRRHVIDEIPFSGEIHRIYPVHAEITGFNIKQIPVTHRERKYGYTKYGLNRILKFFIDILFARFRFAVATKPTYVFGGLSLFFFSTSVTMFLVAITLRVLNIKDYLDGALVIGGIVVFMAAVFTAFQAVVVEIILNNKSHLSQREDH